MSGHYLDHAYSAATDRANFFPAGSGQVVWAWYGSQSPAVNLTYGMLMHLGSDNFVNKFAYADATDTTDSHLTYAGRCNSLAVTGSVIANKLIKLRLGIE